MKRSVINTCSSTTSKVQVVKKNNFQGLKKVKAQGIGVHKPEEILEFGKQDLKVLSELLADKPFFFGDEPTTVRIKFDKISIVLVNWKSQLFTYNMQFKQITSLVCMTYVIPQSHGTLKVYNSEAFLPWNPKANRNCLDYYLSPCKVWGMSQFSTNKKNFNIMYYYCFKIHDFI